MTTIQWQEAGVTLSRRVSIKGAAMRAAWLEFGARIPWTQIATLTFDPKRIYPVDSSKAERQAVLWRNVVEWGLRRPVPSLISVERTRNGQHHSHVLLADVKDDLQAFALMWQLRRGRADIRPVNDRGEILLYLTKQLAHGGNIVVSSTLDRYRLQLNATAVSISDGEEIVDEPAGR